MNLSDTATKPPPPAIAWTEEWAPFLDIDGTLLDFAGHPAAVVVPKDLVAMLERLRERCGCLALVTGRSLDQVDALFGPDRFHVAASHGAVIRSALGTRDAAGHGESTRAIAGHLEALVARHPGTFVEDKGHSVALHFRLAPEAAPALLAAAEDLAAQAPETWRVLTGKGVVEIAPRAASKGTAIGALLGEAGYSGKRPFFAGDDLTDEDGFAMVDYAGGLGVLVGPNRPSAARWRIPGPEAFRRWLAAGLGPI
ncbi:trehalose-phosphatase [Prosthecomicrobium sp. N25]|uniref:trehalose-phosphatase n=1 Tax=Prosthecomicrobium sp. N25 TaxID=3129254 RepID=UPI003076A121